MKLNDLKTGMWVKLRNGLSYMVLRNASFNDLCGRRDIMLSQFIGYILFENYDDNLTSIKSTDFDIVEVFITPVKGCLNKISPECIWTRKEKPDIPPQTKSLLGLLNPEFKNGWIAKDKSGRVYVFQNKPYKGKNDCWVISGERIGEGYRRIPHEYLFLNGLFDWLSWEDEEPWYIPDFMATE